MNSESESEGLLREPWQEKPGWREAWQEKPGRTHTRTFAARKRVREKRRARIERGAGDVSEEPGNKNDEQVAVRHADASGCYIMENHHEEKRMRSIRVNKRGSRATSEEQLDEWRKTERLEHEAPNTSASSDPRVALEHRVSCENKVGRCPYLVQKSGRVDDDMRITALDAFYEKDGRRVVTSEKCWSGIEEKMPEISRELNWLRSGYVSMFPRRNFFK